MSESQETSRGETNLANLGSFVEQMRPTKQQKAGKTRKERLAIRNENILLELASGKSKDDICEDLKLSKRHLNRILQDLYQGAEDWYNLLPRQYKIDLFKINSQKVLKQIMKLERLQEQYERDQVKDMIISLAEKIVNLRIKYDEMIADGVYYHKIKEDLEEVDKLLVKQA